MSTNRNSVVFCDFDGTITSVETFLGVLKTFSPELCSVLVPKIFAKEVTLRDGVRQILHSIPSNQFEQILTYISDKPIRSGLSSLLDFLDEKQVPFIVVSGGLRSIVETILRREQLLDRCASIYALDVDLSGEYLKVESKFENGNELVAKVDVMNDYCKDGFNEKIIIGDSLTDLNISMKADLVFARDSLCQYLKDENKSFFEWTDFNDIKMQLAQRWK
ncbi:unnamed protein product [Didymodactylos carnosus]|uniref:Phosphoserine phosphatase n=1 Tax=Didymodactylos carnosus TaxID=1234261 RepID=A0A815UN83_9BILA|nr:unnamed protein product [Didymodactylos carnosus]CAF1516151.1 unnamed protein product [Didymodactylos carnosus]CAF4223352.1 unnamed protein product [Didymodactylos carnosus]CAF4376040.1 unnamed protein product [Didymodactylos carnosus]